MAPDKSCRISRNILIAALSLLVMGTARVAIAQIDQSELSDAADGSNWPAYGRSFSEQRFSPLDQINTQNVPKLGLAWTYDVPNVWNVSTAPVAVDGVIYFSAGYSVVHAVDAVSGKLLWKYDPQVSNEKMRMAWGSRGLTYWKGRIYTGVQDGRLLALDAKSGELAWEVLTTESGDHRYITGAPRAFNNKIIIGHGGADFPRTRGYVTAYDADTGEYVWHYQTNPGETWDFNSSMDMVLADADMEGVKRKILMHAPKNGFFYVIDREDGNLLSAEKLGKVTWAERIDLQTGRPVELPSVRYENGEALMWPGPGGVHNWQPMSYSPDTGLVYIPTREMAGYYNDVGIEPRTWDVDKDSPLGLNIFVDDIPMNAGSSALLAWDPIRQKRIWSVETPGVTNGGLMSTHGGLVFQGRADGRFGANDAKTGAELWSSEMGVGTQAPPITFTVDGKQYVSILAGWAGGQMLMGSMSAQHAWVGRKHPKRLLTYVLDGDAKLPSPPAPEQVTVLRDASFKIDDARAAKGQTLYDNNCLICHALAAVAGGAAPDLRASSVPLSADAFNVIVRDGALLSQGMPMFDDMSAQELDAIRHFIRQRAEHEVSFWDQLTII